jgi:hypothetical protein
MKCKLRNLGLALLAVMAMGALSSSAASAGEFHSESGTETVIKGSQVGTDVITVNAGTVKCSEVTYAGTQAGATATTVKVTPTYSECTAFGFVNTKIDTNGCEFELSGDNGSVKIICPAGKAITVTAFNCEVTIFGQEVHEVLTYTNYGVASTRHIGTNWHLSIKYIQHSKSFPGCSGHTTTFSGTWSSASTIRCYTLAGVQIGCWRQ